MTYNEKLFSTMVYLMSYVRYDCKVFCCPLLVEHLYCKQSDELYSWQKILVLFLIFSEEMEKWGFLKKKKKVKYCITQYLLNNKYFVLIAAF